MIYVVSIAQAICILALVHTIRRQSKLIDQLRKALDGACQTMDKQNSTIVFQDSVIGQQREVIEEMSAFFPKVHQDRPGALN